MTCRLVLLRYLPKLQYLRRLWTLLRKRMIMHWVKNKQIPPPPLNVTELPHATGLSTIDPGRLGAYRQKTRWVISFRWRRPRIAWKLSYLPSFVFKREFFCTLYAQIPVHTRPFVDLISVDKGVWTCFARLKINITITLITTLKQSQMLRNL